MALDEIILDLLDLEEHPEIDEIYDHYMELSKKMMDIDNLDDAVTELATEIYEYLIQFLEHTE